MGNEEVHLHWPDSLSGLLLPLLAADVRGEVSCRGEALGPGRERRGATPGLEAEPRAHSWLHLLVDQKLNLDPAETTLWSQIRAKGFDSLKKKKESKSIVWNRNLRFSC